MTNHTTDAVREGAPFEPWQRKTLLVLGMTYPSYSTTYQELVCTGAIDEATGQIVRIYPMPKRYMDESFKNWQRIVVDARPNRYDGRPDSIRIDFDTVEALDEIPAKEVKRRRRALDESPSFARSLEELQDRNNVDLTSLGVMRPKSIDGIHIRKRSPRERAAWYAVERKLMSQATLPLVMRPQKKLDFPEVTFDVAWTCDDPRCTGHESGLKSWGIHELYRKLRNDPDREAKVKAQMERTLDLTKRDVYLFLGTFHTHQTTFGLMEVYSAPKVEASATNQLPLFGA